MKMLYDLNIEESKGISMRRKRLLRWGLSFFLALIASFGGRVAYARGLYADVEEGNDIPEQAVVSYLANNGGTASLHHISLRKNRNGAVEGNIRVFFDSKELLAAGNLPDGVSTRQKAHTISRIFLEKNAKDLLEIESLRELREFHTNVDPRTDTTVVTFHRYIHDVKLEKFFVEFTIRSDGFASVTARLVALPQSLFRTSNKEILSEDKVKEIVFSLPQWEQTEQEYRADKRFKMEKTLTPECLAYVVKTSAWQVWLNATTGEVLKVVPTIIRD